MGRDPLGAGSGNRTRVWTLATSCLTFQLYLHAAPKSRSKYQGVEPCPTASMAAVQPLHSYQAIP